MVTVYHIFFVLLAAMVIYELWEFAHGAIVCRRYFEAHNSPAIRWVADFWAQRLIINESMTEEHRTRFCGHLLNMLSRHYSNHGRFPAIGVWYHRPHEYGVDDLMWRALDWTGIVHAFNRDIGYHHIIGEGKMTMSLNQVQFETGSGPARVVWTKASGPCSEESPAPAVAG